MTSLLQSFLVIGTPKSARTKTGQIAKSHNTDLENHSADIFIISPQKHILIEQIRDLKRHIFQKPVRDKFKFVIIEEAEKLTTEAQNALLKILEEPPSHAIIVLETISETNLLPTIRSRTIIIRTWLKSMKDQGLSTIAEKDIQKLLSEIAEVENPNVWLDSQIIMLYNQLKQNIRANQYSSSALIREIIKRCIDTKSMIDANINPKFALTNLIFSLKLNV